MPGKKINTLTGIEVGTGTSSDRLKDQESSVETEKSVGVPTLPAKVDDGDTSKGNGKEPTASGPATTTTADKTSPKPQMTLKKIVPVVVQAQ